MSASIILDQDYNTYTNLDQISGRVQVRLLRPTNVSVITVKLEGEARTRLLPPPTVQDQRPRPQLEFHKILYNTQTIFPPPEAVNTASTGAVYSWPPGTHEYSFSFKVALIFILCSIPSKTFQIPFNSQCALEKNAAPAVSLAGMSVEIARAPTQHLRRPLPPTLRGFPGEAEIRYYLKATIARPSLLKENIRQIRPFDFCPIEPPRPPTSGAETYARRKHQFEPISSRPSIVQSPSSTSSFRAKLGALGSTKSPSPSASATSLTPAAPTPTLVAVEIRLPEPPILTSNQDVPLRILITNLNPSTQIQNLTLTAIQIDVAHYTQVRAHNVVRTESGSAVLLSKGNMSVPLSFDDTGVALVPPELWYGLVVPRQLPPSFEICNLSRNYELIVRLGLQLGGGGTGGKGKAAAYAQSTTIDLRLRTQLYSGLAPPPELLASLASENAHAPPLPDRRPSKAPLSPAYHTGIGSGSGGGAMPGAWPSHPPSRPSGAASIAASAVPGATSHGGGGGGGEGNVSDLPAYTPAPQSNSAGAGVSTSPGHAQAQTSPQLPWPDAPPSYEDAADVVSPAKTSA